MRGGILIIGSLLWDERPERRAWREWRLLLEARWLVSASLTYGRRSESRGNTFTMTFDADAGQGTAVVVPCAASACRAEDLVNEAEQLWKAEQPAAAAGAIGAGWGSVGVLFRDPTRAGWLDHWRRVFAQRTAAVPPVDDAGTLRIAWPTLHGGGPLDLDFLLATSTRRDTTRPTPEAVADAWIAQERGHERYFFENVRHGIRTSADAAIWRRMSERQPRWLRASDYAAAIATLPGQGLDEP